MTSSAWDLGTMEEGDRKSDDPETDTSISVPDVRRFGFEGEGIFEGWKRDPPP